MSSSTIQQFTDTSPPSIHVMRPVFHPNGGGTVIGHIGRDEDRDVLFAMLPRNRTSENGEQHYFRKFDGYAVSRDLLDEFESRNVTRVCIVERDGDKQVYEFERQQFISGEFVAYDDESNSIVESELEYLDNKEQYSDPQQVLSVDDAVHVWDKSEVSMFR